MLPKGCNLSDELKLSAAANLLLGSRKKPGSSQVGLMTALGKQRLVIQGEVPKARRPGVAEDADTTELGAKPCSTIAEGVGRTRDPLTSIAELGMMVRSARKAMNMNQAEFAAHAGVGRRFVSELEGGKPSLEFDKVLGCAVAAGIDLLAKRRRARCAGSMSGSRQRTILSDISSRPMMGRCSLLTPRLGSRRKIDILCRSRCRSKRERSAMR